MDRETRLIILAIVGIIVGLWAFLYAATFVEAWTYGGQEYDVVVVVQAVEKSTRFGDHTNVWCLVYGDQDITYTFFGHLDFKVGKTYRIKFTDRIKWTLFGYEAWGKVSKMEVEG